GRRPRACGGSRCEEAGRHRSLARPGAGASPRAGARRARQADGTQRPRGRARIRRGWIRVRFREAAGAVRPRRNAAHRSAARAGSIRAAGAERPARPGDPGSSKLLGAHVSRGAQGAARALSEAPVAGGSVEREADGTNKEGLKSKVRSEKSEVRSQKDLTIYFRLQTSSFPNSGCPAREA